MDSARLARVWQRAAPAAVSFSVVVADGLAGGGYFPRAWRLTTFAFLAFAAAALVGRERIPLARIERVFLAGLAAVTSWIALSTLWSDTPDTSVLEGERALVYLAGVALLLLALERDAVEALLGGALAGLTTVSGYGLVTYLLYGRHHLNPIEGRLLFEPLGYANGLGIYTAMGILLGAGLALSTPRAALRIAFMATLAVLVPVLYLTGSRAAELSVAVGLVVLARFAGAIPRRLAVGLALGAAAAVALAAVAIARQEHGLVSALAGANRPHYWHVAWRETTMNPLLGSGAGTFERYWLHYRPISSFARDAHSLYLETLAEVGPIGLALLLATLATPLAVLRGRRDPLLATAAAGYVAFLVHAGVDWDWELPAVTLTGLVCGASMLVAVRSDSAPAIATRERVVALVIALALAVLALVRLKTGAHLPFGS